MNQDEIGRIKGQIEDITCQVEQLSIKQRQLTTELQSTVNKLRQLQREGETGHRNQINNTQQRTSRPVMPERHYNLSFPPLLGDQTSHIIRDTISISTNNNFLLLLYGMPYSSHK